MDPVAPIPQFINKTGSPDADFVLSRLPSNLPLNKWCIVASINAHSCAVSVRIVDENGGRRIPLDITELVQDSLVEAI